VRLAPSEASRIVLGMPYMRLYGWGVLMIHKMFLPVFVQHLKDFITEEQFKQVMLDVPRDTVGEYYPHFTARYKPTNKKLYIGPQLFKMLSREDPVEARFCIHSNFGVCRYYAHEFSKLIR
jgi:hypothetical protein